MKKPIFFLCYILGVLGIVVAQSQNNEPQLFPLSTGHEESSITFAPDGKTAYFRKGIAWSNVGIIVFSQLRNGRWTEPEVASFSGLYSDGAPSISPDGKRLFFSSLRPVDGKTAKTDLDIWVVEKTAGGWSEPKNLGPPINTPSLEISPSVAADGTLYFDSNRAGGRGSLDIYRSRLVEGKYTEPENLGEAINSTNPDSNPCIDARGERLFFASNRTGGAGAWDIYVSANRNGRWEAARNIGSAINTDSVERWPALSPDGRHLFFTSNRGIGGAPSEKELLTYQRLIGKLRSAGNESADIYRVTLSALKFD
jgi:dipeptidyl aminopeptidase/acylaminoacyl peptidase